MKKLSFRLALLLHLILIQFFFINSQQGNNPDGNYKNYYPNFSVVSTAYYYLPGDTVRMNVRIQWIKKNADFKIIVYKIKDPEVFYLSQQNRWSFDVVARDSSNLLSLLEQADSFDKTLTYKKKNPKETEPKDAFSIEDQITYVPKDYGTYLA